MDNNKMAESAVLPALPEWMKFDDLGGKVPSEIRTAFNAHAREAWTMGLDAGMEHAPAAVESTLPDLARLLGTASKDGKAVKLSAIAAGTLYNALRTPAPAARDHGADMDLARRIGMLLAQKTTISPVTAGKLAVDIVQMLRSSAAEAVHKGRWMKVADQLPPESARVLTCGPEFEEAGNDFWVASANFDVVTGFFDFGDDEDEEHYQPSHWIPMIQLPAAPTAGSAT